MACDLETIQSSACDSGIGKLTDSVSLLRVIAQLLCDVSTSGGGGGSGQIKIYVADPNSEGVVPDDMTKPGIAYSENAALSNYNWSVVQQQWI